MSSYCHHPCTSQAYASVSGCCPSLHCCSGLVLSCAATSPCYSLTVLQENLFHNTAQIILEKKKINNSSSIYPFSLVLFWNYSDIPQEYQERTKQATGWVLSCWLVINQTQAEGHGLQEKKKKQKTLLLCWFHHISLEMFLALFVHC